MRATSLFKNHLRPAASFCLVALARVSLVLLCGLFTTGALATTFYWDAAGTGAGLGGSGTWDASSSLWHSVSWNGTLQAWPNTGVNTDTAVLTNAAGTVTLNSSSTTINVNSIVFTNSTGTYLIAPPASGSATLNFSGVTPSIITSNSSATISAVISGSSSITRRGGSGTLILTGNNTISGSFSNFTSTGTLIISNANAFGSATVAMEQNAGTTAIGLKLAGGITLANAITIDTATGRENIDGVSGNNTLSGPITILGATSTSIVLANDDAANAGTTFAISNTISTSGAYPNSLSLRPNQVGDLVKLAGTVNLSSNSTININGPGILLITSTGNVWGNFNLNGNGGTVRCGAANCLYSGARVSNNNGINTLDLAGFSQLVAGLDGFVTNGIIITNGSATSDATLTLNTTANTGTGGNAGTAYGFGGIIGDGVHKLNLVLTGGSETLSNLNTYSGGTTITGGTLALATNNSIKNSTSLALAAGAVFDVSLIANYTNYNAALTASGAGISVGSTAAAIKGGTSVNLGSQPITLNFTPVNNFGDLSSPALYLSQGNLTLNGQISVTNLSGSPLGTGTYALIQAAGTVGGSPTLNPNIAGNGLTAGTAARLALSGSLVELVVYPTGQPLLLTIARHAGTGTSTTYGSALQFDVTASASAASGGTVTVMDGGIGGTALSSGGDILPGGSPNTVTVTMTALNALTVGAHTNIVAVYGGDSSYGGTNSAALTPAQTIGPLSLTLTGAAGGSKPYNGTTAATFTGTLNGVVSGDVAGVDVYLIGTGVFANAGPGTNIAITASGTLGGDKAADYILTQPTGLAGDIDSTAIWNTTASGELWSTAGDWLDNAVGDGAGAIVDFSQAGITSDTLVYLDSPRTMGTLIFGDASTNTPASWFLDNNGVGGNTLTMTGNTPEIMVNALGGGSTVTIDPVVAGANGLTVAGAGWLILATNNTWSGGTTIAGGTLQIGADQTLPIGTLGSGNVTNNGTLIFENSSGLTLTNYMTGAGVLVQDCTNAMILVGTNAYSGGTTVSNAGALIISSAYSIGTGPVNLDSKQLGSNPTFQFSGGINLTNTINLGANLGREFINATSGNNTLSGPMNVIGFGSTTVVLQNNAAAGAGAMLAISNTITAPSYTGALSLRGSAGNFGQLAGVVTAPGMQMQLNGNANWLISSSGNSWSYTSFSAGAANNAGSLICGAVNCLPATARVTWTGSSSNVLDLAGYSQTIAGLDCAAITSGAPLVTNSSATSDAVLTITNGSAYTFSGPVKDGAAHKIALTIAGGSQTLTATNTYSGNTTISNGTLSLASTALLNNSTALAIGYGGTFDVSAITDFTNNGATLTASGLVGTPATINGGTTISLDPQSVILNYTPASTTGDLSDPALSVGSAALTLNGQITVNSLAAAPLGSGTYTLISATSGSLAGNLTLNPAIGGQGIQSNPDNFVALQITGGTVNLLVAAFTGSGTPTTTTIARSAGVGSSTTYGDAVSFDVTVSPTPNDGEIVAIKDGGASGTLLGYGTLASGACTVPLSLNTLAAGSHPNIVAVYYGDDTLAGSASTALFPQQSVAQKGLTVSGAAASNRPYNGGVSATINGTLTGVVSGDTAGVDVYLIGTGTFANAGPGVNLTVTSTATLGGGKSADYSLTQPGGLAADIVTAAIWNTAASGQDWSTPGDWVDNAIGDGAGATVNFNQVDITINPTVAHLDSPRTMQTLIFGDANTGSAASWLLDNNGTPANTLTLAGSAPGITVNALGAGQAATVSAVMAGSSGMTKSGSGTLILAGNNAWSGGTTVSAGTLQIGSGAAAGTLGGGSVTNNGALVMDRSDNVNITNPISGVGSLSYSGNSSLTLSGANTYSGGTTVAALGALVITNSTALGVGPVNLQATQTGPGTTFQFGGGVNITNAINLNSATGREYLLATNGNNTLSGSLVITGAVAVSATIVVANGDANNAGTLLTVSGPITAASFNQTLSLRGNSGNSGLLSSVVTAPNLNLNLNGNATWTINSTGNSWTNFSFSAGAANNVGTLACGVANCFPASAPVVWASGSSNILDLAGFSQTIGGLNCASTTGSPVPVVTNSSVTSDAVLTINGGTNIYTFVGTINDGASHKLALTVSGGTNTLAGADTYTGNTTVNGGKLILQLPTLSANSTVAVAAGAGLQLGFAVSNQVAALVLNGVSQAAGVYNAATSPAYLAGAGSLLVVSTGPGVFTNPTGITGFSLNGANVVITATNGQAGDAYYLLESTNLALPVNQWTAVATNVLGSAGNYTFNATNVIIHGAGQQFFRLSNTNN